MRTKIVAGNWKMNKTLPEAQELGRAIAEGKASLHIPATLICAPPALYLGSLKSLAIAGVALAAQNCSEHASGAYTGEHSAAMLASMQIAYCIVGHSERRQYFGESDVLLASKVDACLANGVKPIYCCGELLPEREADTQFDVVGQQVKTALFHLAPEQWLNVVIAYEPVWAIGTGKTASADQAQEMHAYIRGIIAEGAGRDVADAVRILYGGSVNAANSAELFACPDVDGGLVGGASLKAADFLSIAASAS
jgi:triosephosphate isomerase (TIM)